MIESTDPPPPNKPPYFTFCPKSRQVYAEEGKTTANIFWQTPTAADPEDGTLR